MVGGTLDDKPVLGVIHLASAALDSQPEFVAVGARRQLMSADILLAESKGGDSAAPFPGFLGALTDLVGKVDFLGGIYGSDGLESDPATYLAGATVLSVQEIAAEAFNRLEALEISGGGGTTGPTSAPDRHVHFVQAQAASLWVITHTFPYPPSCTVVDSTGEQVWTTITFPNPTTILVEFSAATAGDVYLS